MMSSKHGIAIRERPTGRLVEFIVCGTGREALMVLSGVRRNLGRGFDAQEEVIKESEIVEMKETEK